MTRMARPLRSTDITPLPRYYEPVRPCPAYRYFRPRGAAACAFSLITAEQVLKFRARANASGSAADCPAFFHTLQSPFFRSVQGLVAEHGQAVVGEEPGGSGWADDLRGAPKAFEQQRRAFHGVVRVRSDKVY